MTPRGGTGMNTAMHDGWDMGWKLACVLRGWAGPALLDSYETERRPVAEHNTARSADPEGAAGGVGLALSADLGGRIPHLWVPTAAGRVSTLDLLGPGLTLFTGPDARCVGGGGRPRRGAGPRRRPQPRRDRRPGAGDPGGGALLARPDGVPVGLWPSPDRAVASSAELARA